MSAEVAPFTAVGGIAGVAGASMVSWWYAIDAGWTGSGSVLVVSQAPILVAALASAASVLVGSLENQQTSGRCRAEDEGALPRGPPLTCTSGGPYRT
jgi:hypothetical protein